jgi:hypothetical protein
MKMNVFKWFSVVAVVLWFSSCSMEKRLYSSGFHIQWNTKESGSTKNDWVKVHKQPSLKVATIELDTKSPSVVADCRDIKEETSKDGSVSASMRPALSTDNHSIVKGPATYQTNINKASVPKPRKGETVEQMAQRKVNKAKLYKDLAVIFSLGSWFVIPLVVISLTLSSQVEDLSLSGKKIEAAPKLKPGETIEAFAQRKADQSRRLGIISLPTTFFIVGYCFAVWAIIAGRRAKKFAPDNDKIQKRAKAGITWATVSLVLFALILTLVLMIGESDFFI